MKLTKNIGLFLFLGISVLTSCSEEEGPSIDDNFLNYEIPEVPVTADCPVGAYYYNNGSTGLTAAIYTRVTESVEAAGKVGPNVEPILGNYATRNSEESVDVMQQHVDWAISAGINFFIMDAVNEDASKAYPNNLNSENVRFVNLSTGRIGSDGKESDITMGKTVDMKGLKYAMSVNPNNIRTSPSPSLDNNNLIEDAPVQDATGLTKVQRFNDMFKRVSDFFSDPNYYRIDGKPVVVVLNPQLIYSADSEKLYDDMRAYVKSYSGEDIYIIAQQTSWTPPARFEYFHIDGKVDAITHTCMYNQSMMDRSYWYPQLIDQNWKYFKDYILTNWNIDFIPVVSPSFTFYVNSGSNYNIPMVSKDPAVFKTLCNVAKRNLGKNRIVFVESFNQWRYNSALEPTNLDYGKGYGTTYLDIVKEQFKK